MVRRIALGVCVLWGVIACPVALAAQDDPAELYRQREDLMNAERVADLWAPAASSDYDAAWQLARISYWIGTHAPRNDRRAALQRGIGASQTAIRLDGDRPEGHFWLAADMGALAENSGLITGLKLVGRIRRELERVIALAPLWQQGSAETALGQWYFKVPRLVGGSRSKARVNLVHVLNVFPNNMMALMFLAQLSADDGHPDEARALWQRVLDVPIDPAWAPEGHDFQRKATARLESLARAQH